MKLFVDASAIIAILAQESDGRAIAAKLDEGNVRLWSPMSCWEAINGLKRALKASLEDARRDVEALASARNFRLVPIGEAERVHAIEAYRIFGKGRHEAQLNMGDCFAYACTKTNDAVLLYKGDDFARTDLA